MRTRIALSITSFALAAGLAAFSIDGGFTASSATTKEASWTSLSAIRITQPTTTQPSDATVMMRLAHQRMVYLNAVQAALVQRATAAQAAAQAAARLKAQATVSGSMSPPTITTGAPGTCAPSYQATQAARAEAAGVPCAWVPTAICEEQGNDDPAYGFFGIQAWGGYGGYDHAGSAPLSVQLGWESAHHQGPPDAPGQCHGY